MKSKILVSVLMALVLVINQFFTYSVIADEYVVEGNGDGSSNSINTQQENNDSIEQNNASDIDSEVAPQADTGENSVSGNTGENTDVTTGDASIDASIHNSGNSSLASIDCCPDEPSSVVISGNGSDSENSVGIAIAGKTEVTISNNLKLTNNIEINVNTGDNEANDNGGDVTINTGEVNILAQILNKDLNSAYLSASKKNPSFNIKVSGNGSGSTNLVTEEISEEEQFNIFNDSFLNNYFVSNSNTGGNRASRNSGKVFISTGNVYLDFILLNKVNTSKIIAECCKEKPSPTPTPTPTPSGSPTPSPSSPPGSSCCSEPSKPGPPGGGGGGPGGGGGGQVQGASLPATGGFSIWQATMFALLLMAGGILLRLDYGKTQDRFRKQATVLAFMAFFKQTQKNPWKYSNRNFLLPNSFNLLTNPQSLFTG